MMNDAQNIKPFMGEYLSRLGVDIQKAQKANTACPVCKRGEDTGCFHYYRDTEKVKCFSCGFGGDIVDLYQEMTGTEKAEAFEALRVMFNVADYSDTKTEVRNSVATMKPKAEKAEKILDPKASAPVLQEKNYTEYYLQCQNNVGKVDYWHKRGLTDRTIEKFMLGYDPNSDRVIIPVSPVYYKARRINDDTNKPKYYNPSGAKIDFLNSVVLQFTERPIFLVEGEIDAMSIDQAGGNAIALSSTTNVEKFIELLNERRNSGNDLYRFPFVLSFDEDESGKKATEKASELLTKAGIPHITDNSFFIGCKDANEALMKDADLFAAELQRVEAEAVGVMESARKKALEEYRAKSQMVSKIDSLFEYQTGIASKAISTGIEALDSALDGGLYPGAMYSIGAGTGAGKTAFVLQIADNIAKAGRDVLYISLELPDVELIARSCSRISYTSAKRYTDTSTARNIMRGNFYTDKAEELAYNAISRYSAEIAPCIYVAAPDDIRDFNRKKVAELVKEHKRITGNSPVVILDYLQILQYEPGEERLSDKQKIDRDVIEMKSLAKQMQTPVIVVSAINRNSYKDTEKGLESFKESGSIEYTSDVAIVLNVANKTDTESMTEDALERQKFIPKKIDMRILKNRYGSTGTVKAFFMPMFGYYSTESVFTGATKYSLTEEEKSLFYARMPDVLPEKQSDPKKKQQSKLSF